VSGKAGGIHSDGRQRPLDAPEQVAGRLVRLVPAVGMILQGLPQHDASALAGGGVRHGSLLRTTLHRFRRFVYEWRPYATTRWCVAVWVSAGDVPRR
jgi:hypothetical protein